MILSPNFDFLFLLISICSVFASIMVIFNKNPLHSILFLILVFANMSLLLLIQKIEFLSLIILMVYIGAIAVLFLFVIYMLNIKIIELNEMNSSYLLGISLVFIIIIFELIINFLFSNSDSMNVAYTANLFVEDWSNIFYHLSNIKIIGINLYFANYFLFIIISVILLLAMIGSIVLTSQKTFFLKEQDIFEQIRRYK